MQDRSFSRGFDDVAARMLDAVLAEVPSAAAALFVLDYEQGKLRPQAQRGGTAVSFTNVPELAGESLGAVTLLTPVSRGHGFLAVPMRSRNRFCGLIAVQLRSELPLTAALRRRLRDIGDRAGEMVESARTSDALQRRTDQLKALYSAGILMSSGLDLDIVLQRVADLAAELLAAKYAALGVADEKGVLQQFFTSGISQQERARIGHIPEGKGLLGAIIKEKRVIRLADIAQDPRSSGFPAHHPAMHSFIGMPIMLGERVLGNLYVTEKRAGEFTQDDEDLLGLLSSQAAVAIENARMYGQVQRLTAMEERERIGMDLHDSVIQSLYAVGLGLEEVADELRESELLGPVTRIEQRIEQLNEAIRSIRGFIQGLQGNEAAAPLTERVARLAEDVRAEAGIQLNLMVRADIAARLSPTGAEAVLQVLREALSNAHRHGQAKTAAITLSEERDRAVLTVRDDGRGFDLSRTDGGMGLPNMRSRAMAVGGALEIESRPGEGTTVRIELPLLPR